MVGVGDNETEQELIDTFEIVGEEVPATEEVPVADKSVPVVLQKKVQLQWLFEGAGVAGQDPGIL